MNKDKTKFVRDLEEVSVTLAVWAQEQFSNGWSIDDVKIALRAAAKLTGRP